MDAQVTVEVPGEEASAEEVLQWIRDGSLSDDAQDVTVQDYDLQRIGDYEPDHPAAIVARAQVALDLALLKDEPGLKREIEEELIHWRRKAVEAS